jgi:predicted nucleic acid-binding protein
MILVDTSIWIEFLNRREPFCNYMLYLLKHREVMALEPIFAELLQGASGEEEIQLLTDYFNSLEKPELENLLIKAGTNSSKDRWFAKGLGIIDAAILSASLLTKTPLWTLDKNLKRLTPEQLVYEPTLA